MERTELIKKILKENEDLDFLDTHWKKLNDIGSNIKTNLPKTGSISKPIGDKLHTVQFSDLDNSWDIQLLYGKSNTLTALADKIQNMIFRGRSDSIKRMVESIANNNVKTLYKIHQDGSKESLGKGHFRWNDQAYVLTPRELEQVKIFFGL